MFGKRFFVGFDVGESELKVVILRRRGSSVEIAGLNRVALQLEGEERCEEVGRKLSEVLSAHRVNDAAICACVPMTACTLRRITLPPVKRREMIEQLAQVEMQNQMPFSFNRVAFSHVVQSFGRDGTHVLVGMCKHEAVEFLLRAAHAAGLELNVITPSALACWQAANDEALNERLTCVIDIGAASTDVVVGHARDVFVARSVPVGTGQLLKAISEDASCSSEEAEWKMRRNGIDLELLREGETQGADNAVGCSSVLKWLLKLEEEILKTAQMVERAFGSSIRKVLLCGGGALIPNLVDWLGRRLGISVQLLEMPRLAGSHSGLIGKDEFMLTAAAYGAARSLALRRSTLNFAPRRPFKLVIIPKVLKQVALLLLALNVGLVVLALSYNSQLKQLQVEAEALAKALEERRSQLRSEVATGSLMATVSAMRHLLTEVSDVSGDWLEMLYGLSMALPKDVWLSELECARGREVTMRGTALSYRALDEAVRSIRQLKFGDGDKSTMFSDVVVTSVVSREVAGRTVVDFRLVCSLARRKAIPVQVPMR